MCMISPPSMATLTGLVSASTILVFKVCYLHSSLSLTFHFTWPNIEIVFHLETNLIRSWKGQIRSDFWMRKLAVHGVEYAFGAHEQATTGIFEGEPRKCEGFTFRKSILIGWSEMSGAQVRGLMEQLAEKYRGNAYNLITKNCNHFCNDACIQLTGNPIPNWINRLARIGKSSFPFSSPSFTIFTLCVY